MRTVIAEPLVRGACAAGLALLLLLVLALAFADPVWADVVSAGR